MSDLLLNLSRNNFARKVVAKSRLPITLPAVLRRETFPWRHQSLLGRNIALGGRSGQGLFQNLEKTLWDAGATLPQDDGVQLQGVLFDATAFTAIDDLKELYAFMHRSLPKLAPSSRILIVGQIPLALGVPAATAVQEALVGFTRSLAKELGKKATTVNLIEANDGAQLGGALRFFLADYAAFVTGQVLAVGSAPLSEARYEELLADRTILVTGAAQGIGAAISRRLAGEGARVILLDRPQELPSLELLAKEIAGVVLPVELGKADSTAAVVKKLWEYAPIHGVVHNAGVTRDKTLARMNEERWDGVLNINLQVPVAMTEMMLDKEHDSLLAKGAGFVFLSSIGGIAGNPGQTNYAASKAGLIGYVRALAGCHLGQQVRFNCVAPGFIETRMTAAMPFAVREMARRFNSLNQGGVPDDVAQAVTWLISKAGSGVNGQTLRVCGQNLVGS